MVKLPQEYVEKYVAEFAKLGMEAPVEVVEEILWDLALQGVEEPKYLRYYTLGNKFEKQIYTQIENSSKGELVEGKINIRDKYYTVACNKSSEGKDT